MLSTCRCCEMSLNPFPNQTKSPFSSCHFPRHRRPPPAVQLSSGRGDAGSSDLLMGPEQVQCEPGEGEVVSDLPHSCPAPPHPTLQINEGVIFHFSPLVSWAEKGLPFMYPAHARICQ